MRLESRFCVQLYMQKAKLSTDNPAFAKKSLTSKTRSPYSIPTVAKSTAGRGNPVPKMANDSTPQACFFIRSTNTSKASYKRLDLLNDGVLWARFALDCLPFLAVFPPRKTLSPNTVESVSDSSLKSKMELSEMIYLFLAKDRFQNNHTEIVRIEAENSLQARLSLHPEWRLVIEKPLKAFQRFQETAFFPPLHTVCNRKWRLCKPTKTERAEIALFMALNAHHESRKGA